MKNNENFNNLKHNIRDLNRNMTTTSRIVNNFFNITSLVEIIRITNTERDKSTDYVSSSKLKLLKDILNFLRSY